jgi:hypothetical protein
MANVVWFDQNKIYEAGFTKPPRDWQAAATTRGNSQKPRRGENSMALVFCPELPKSDCPRTTLMSHRAKAHPMKPHPISYGELMRLGVDDSNRLYSDRKPVIIEQRLTFGLWPKVGAVIMAVSALIQAVAAAWQVSTEAGGCGSAGAREGAA